MRNPTLRGGGESGQSTATVFDSIPSRPYMHELPYADELRARSKFDTNKRIFRDLSTGRQNAGDWTLFLLFDECIELQASYGAEPHENDERCKWCMWSGDGYDRPMLPRTRQKLAAEGITDKVAQVDYLAKLGFDGYTVFTTIDARAAMWSVGETSRTRQDELLASLGPDRICLRVMRHQVDELQAQGVTQPAEVDDESTPTRRAPQRRHTTPLPAPKYKDIF